MRSAAASGAAQVGRRLAAEGLGTLLLVAIVVGSGIMGERLSAGNAALTLLASSAATAGGLYVLIEVFGPISGAHFNPVVSVVLALRGEIARGMLALYVGAQTVGAVLGACLAHAMFDLDLLQLSTRLRAGPGQWLAEAVAAFGLVLVVLRAPRERIASLVACYIGAAYWFTASTSFANPAVAVGRMFSGTFAGIAPASVPAFAVAELAGAVVALLADRLLDPVRPRA